jgi:protein TonB
MASYRLSTPYDRPPLRRRVSGLALALGANLLLLLVLLTLGAGPKFLRTPAQPLVVDFLPAPSSPAARTADKPVMVKPRTTPRPHPKLPHILPIKPPIRLEPPPPDELIPMSKADLAASDLSNLARSGSGGAGDSRAVGKGPNGETLYAAEWARHPTDAELGGYLPANAKDGFGLIACKTIPENRVEDCIELDQSPGSHLASAVRQAAWQFRVRPPRRNGRPMIGEWVEIRIDYYHSGRD